MKKVLSFILIAVMAVSLFTSCEESASVADMRITLNSNASRLIAPEGVPLEVTNYQISGNGPNGATFNFTTTKTSTTLSGVAVGEWTVNAVGYNTDSLAIVQGSTTFTLSASNPGVVVHLDELIGTGNLSISMSWNTEVVTNPRIELELTKQNESNSEKITASLNTSQGTATASKSGLASGSYILQGRLYSSDVLMSGFTEAVRIVGDKTSSKAIEFNLDNFPFAPGSIQLLDQSGIPVDCKVEGISQEEINAGEAITVSLVPERANLSDLTVNWYIDGVYKTTGTEVSLTFEPGAHRLDAVAYTNKIGSYGSCSISLNALVMTEKGIPGNAIRLDQASTGLKLGTNTVMKFLPDGKLMVMSGLNNTVQIATMVKNGIQVDKEFTNATLPAMGGDPIDFDYHLLDTDTYAISVGFNNPGNTARFNYSIANKSLSQVEACNGIKTTFFGQTATFNSNGGMVGFDILTNMFVMLGYDTNGTTTYLLERYVPSVTADSEYAYRGVDITSELANNLGDGEYKSLNSLAVSPDGLYYIVGNANGEIAKLGHYVYSGGRTQKNNYIALPKTNSYVGLRKIDISDNDVVYLMGLNFIAAYNATSKKELSYTTVASANFTDFAINEATGHLYLVSADEMKIYCYPLNSDGSINTAKVQTVTTLNSNKNIELSVDGSYLVLYTKSAASQVEVMRIRTTD